MLLTSNSAGELLLSVKLVLLPGVVSFFQFRKQPNKRGTFSSEESRISKSRFAIDIEKSTSYILYLLCNVIISFDFMLKFAIHVQYIWKSTSVKRCFERLDVDIIYLMWCKEFIDWKWWMLQNISWFNVLHSAYTFIQ